MASQESGKELEDIPFSTMTPQIARGYQIKGGDLMPPEPTGGRFHRSLGSSAHCIRKVLVAIIGTRAFQNLRYHTKKAKLLKIPEETRYLTYHRSLEPWRL